MSIASKSIDQIETTESANLISSLKSRRTGQTGDPERSLINRSIQKVREREEMALHRSIFPGAVQRHEANIQFLEKVMEANNIQGKTSRALLHTSLEKFYNLCNSISNKPVNKIDRSEIDLFISLHFQIKELVDNLKINTDDLKKDFPHSVSRVPVHL